MAVTLEIRDQQYFVSDSYLHVKIREHTQNFYEIFGCSISKKLPPSIPVQFCCFLRKSVSILLLVLLQKTSLVSYESKYIIILYLSYLEKNNHNRQYGTQHHHLQRIISRALPLNKELPQRTQQPSGNGQCVICYRVYQSRSSSMISLRLSDLFQLISNLVKSFAEDSTLQSKY